LVLWELYGMNLREVLLPDERGSRRPGAIRLREHDLSVIAVWDFDATEDEDHWWVDEEVMMKKWKRGLDGADLER
jgi:hypothetical protein